MGREALDRRAKIWPLAQQQAPEPAPITKPVTVSSRRFAKNHSQDVGALGADGHADANFLGALDHHVRNNAVEANGGEQRCQKSEEAGERGHQLILKQRVLNARFEDLEFKVDAGIHIGDRFFHRSR